MFRWSECRSREFCRIKEVDLVTSRSCSYTDVVCQLVLFNTCTTSLDLARSRVLAAARNMHEKQKSHQLSQLLTGLSVASVLTYDTPRGKCVFEHHDDIRQ